MSLYQHVENLKLYIVLEFGAILLRTDRKIAIFSEIVNKPKCPYVRMSVCLRRSEIRTFCEPIELKFGMYVP